MMILPVYIVMETDFIFRKEKSVGDYLLYLLFLRINKYTLKIGFDEML